MIVCDRVYHVPCRGGGRGRTYLSIGAGGRPWPPGARGHAAALRRGPGPGAASRSRPGLTRLSSCELALPPLALPGVVGSSHGHVHEGVFTRSRSRAQSTYAGSGLPALGARSPSACRASTSIPPASPPQSPLPTTSLEGSTAATRHTAPTAALASSSHHSHHTTRRLYSRHITRQLYSCHITRRLYSRHITRGLYSHHTTHRGLQFKLETVES